MSTYQFSVKTIGSMEHWRFWSVEDSLVVFEIVAFETISDFPVFLLVVREGWPCGLALQPSTAPGVSPTCPGFYTSVPTLTTPSKWQPSTFLSCFLFYLHSTHHLLTYIKCSLLPPVAGTFMCLIHHYVSSLEQCLGHRRHFINICWIDKWRNFLRLMKTFQKPCQ